MKTILPHLIILFASIASASEVRRDVEPGSQLEEELGFTLTVRDKHEDWRLQGLDKVFPITGEAPEYTVRFKVTTDGILEELFGLALSVKDENGILLQVPLETRSGFHDDLARLRSESGRISDKTPIREIDVRFLVKKSLLKHATIVLRCGAPNIERSFAIHLQDYAPDSAKP